jgi:predicted metalloendopeptidase
MNRSVDPCEDFNSFACGGWQAKTFIPTSETSVHTIWAVTNANKQFMRNLLADPATKTKYSSVYRMYFNKMYCLVI